MSTLLYAHTARCSETPSFSELPAKSLDLAAINLTELVNNMLNTALKGTGKRAQDASLAVTETKS